jgi:hypothetical protein
MWNPTCWELSNNRHKNTLGKIDVTPLKRGFSIHVEIIALFRFT